MAKYEGECTSVALDVDIYAQSRLWRAAVQQQQRVLVRAIRAVASYSVVWECAASCSSDPARRLRTSTRATGSATLPFSSTPILIPPTPATRRRSILTLRLCVDLSH